MKTRTLAVWITFIGIFSMAARVAVDTDTWWHLRAGTWMLDNRQILTIDLFSHTRYGQSWLYPGWLAEVPMALFYRLGGPGLLNLWTAFMVTLAFCLLWRVVEGGVYPKAFIFILAATISGVYWAARPYMVTFVLTAAYLQILEQYHRNGKNRLWLLPLLMLIWANSHGGFAVGFIVWGVYGAVHGLRWLSSLGSWNRVIKKSTGFNNSASRSFPTALLIAGFAMLVAACLTPVGPHLLLYPFQTVGISSLREYIQEWQSPDFHSRSVQPFALGIFLLLGVLGASRRRLALSDFLLTTGFGLMSLLAGRNIALFALALPLPLGRHLAPLLEGLIRKLNLETADKPLPISLRRVNLILAGLVLLAAGLKAASVYPEAVNREALSNQVPLQAIAYIQDNLPPGNLFNHYNWGGYLIWALPEHPVFIDGRTDLFGEEIITDWLTVMRVEEGWVSILDKYETELIIIPSEGILAVMLENRPDWELAYRDADVLIFRRG